MPLQESTAARPATHLRASVRIALLVAAGVSVALLVGAFTLPVYSSDGAGGSGSTLIAVNGPAVLLPVAVPLVVTAAIALLLTRVRPPAARIVAWVLVGLLALFAVRSLLTIGSLVLPVVIALAVAVAHAPAEQGVVFGNTPDTEHNSLFGTV